jgi:hypothetical protein
LNPQVDLMLPAIVVPRLHHLRKTSIVNLDRQMSLLFHCLAHHHSIIPLPRQDGGGRQGSGWWSAIVGDNGCNSDSEGDGDNDGDSKRLEAAVA